MSNGRAHRNRRVHSGHDVDDRHTRTLRTAARLVVAFTGHTHEAAHALDHEVVTWLLAIRAGLPKTCDRAVDNLGIDLLQILVAEAVAVQIAGLVVLEDHVSSLGDLAHDRVTIGLRHVDGDRFLAAVRAHEIRRFRRLLAALVLHPGRTERAGVIAFLGTLDLDDVSAEIGQVLRAPGTGEDARKIQNTDMRERPRHRRFLVSFVGRCCPKS